MFDYRPCDMCGKQYIRSPGSIYKLNFASKRYNFCSYSCYMNAVKCKEMVQENQTEVFYTKLRQELQITKQLNDAAEGIPRGIILYYKIVQYIRNKIGGFIMICLTNFPAYDENCKYRFETNPNGSYSVYDKATGEEIIEPDSNLKTEIEQAAEMWKCRCECAVGERVRLVDGVANNSHSFMKNIYETLLAGAIMMLIEQKGENPDSAIPQIRRTLIWLEGTDFFDTAASTRFHDSEPGGLLYHSLMVYNQIILLRSLPQFQNCNLAETVLVALAHDWDKIYKYESYNRNVKNEFGQWEQVLSFRKNQRNVPFGRGTTSMFIASKFVQLSAEAMLAIRWHMGAWDVTGEEQSDLQMANENYPLVHLIQFADQLSITKYAKATYN